jgi:hypothetical protein
LRGRLRLSLLSVELHSMAIENPKVSQKGDIMDDSRRTRHPREVQYRER